MTIQALSVYYNARKALDLQRDILKRLEAAAVPGAQNLDGMPHGHGVSDKVGDLAIEIAGTRDKVKDLEAEADRALEFVTRYIDTIDENFIRVVFRLRFVRCLTWHEAAEIVGGSNTGNSLLLMCKRYLKSQQ